MIKNIGVIGAGQLAQMLGEAASELDLKILALTNDANSCARNTVQLVLGSEADRQSITTLAEQVAVISFEHEHIKTPLYKDINVPIYPNPAAVRIAQHRALEKNFFKKSGVPTPPFAVADSLLELEKAVVTIGFPCVVKTVEGGYDGKGQKVLKDKTDLAAVWQELGASSLIVEGWVAFERELSLVAARGTNGDIVFYPLTENLHRDGILRVSKAPYEHKNSQKLAEQYLTKILEELNYVGVLTVEFFQQGDALIANEMAPRVHNSGHWTIEGAQCSQFSNHLRAVSGKKLGSTAAKGFSAMINIIGQWPDKEKLKNLAWLHMHDYGKAPRVGRKLGHLTIVAATEQERDEKLKEVLEILKL
jgi:5-(carboxyamino)imidazole ribonucleotide synthase